jgi:hypothetical protein
VHKMCMYWHGCKHTFLKMKKSSLALCLTQSQQVITSSSMVKLHLTTQPNIKHQMKEVHMDLNTKINMLHHSKIMTVSYTNAGL